MIINKTNRGVRGKVIAVDMDEVLVRLSNKWIATYNAIFNDTLKVEDVTSWQVSDFVKPEARDFVRGILNIENFYSGLEIIEDSVEVLRKLSEDNTILIVTDPFTKNSYNCKYDTLQENYPFIPTKNYIFTGTKSAIRADYLIDDGLHNLEGFTGKGLVFTAPHNKDNQDYFRVNNWTEVGMVLLNNPDIVDEFYRKKGTGEALQLA